MKLYKVAVLVVIVVLMGCTKDKADNVHIRISNISEYDYKNIIANTAPGEPNFDDVDSQQKSEYRIFEQAYRYGFIELEIEGDTFTYQPIDYVGETLLSNGYYTYQISANDSQEQYGRLGLSLIVD